MSERKQPERFGCQGKKIIITLDVPLESGLQSVSSTGSVRLPPDGKIAVTPSKPTTPPPPKPKS